MKDDKDNKDYPLRVRLTATENNRLNAAAAKFGLERSRFVRWALENIVSSVLGVTLEGTPLAEVKPVKRKPVPKPAPAPEPEPIVEHVAPQAASEPVPDLLTAMGLVGSPQHTVEAATFDDSNWD